MPKHVADRLERDILASLKADLGLDRAQLAAIRVSMRHHIEHIAAKNGCLKMALEHALLNQSPE